MRWQIECGLHVEGIDDGARDVSVAMTLEAATFDKAIDRCKYAKNIA